MAQPHKGDRALIISRAPRDVHEAVAAAAAGRGMSISAYVADLLSLHVGRPDLVRELDQEPEVLPLAV